MTHPRDDQRPTRFQDRLPAPLRGPAGVALLVVLAFALGLALRGGGSGAPDTGTATTAAVEEPTLWTCSMHPQILLPEPGDCPICGMDLIPLEEDTGDAYDPRTLRLSKAAAALAEVQVVPVRRQHATAELRLVGEVASDERLQRVIAAWVPGRLDTLFVDFTGVVVQRGAKMVSIYSPELYAAQTELLSAVRAQRTLDDSGAAGVMSETGAATVEAARERLRLWGLTREQIAAVEAGETPDLHVVIRAPVSGVVVEKHAREGAYVQTGDPLYTVADLDRVWVDMEAYESDLVWLREGQQAAFTVEALPGRRFTGEVVFIDPVLDRRTRTVGVRLEAPNPQGLLKPGMFATAKVDADLHDAALPEGEPDSQPPLVIPSSAPLLTGERAVVYVRLPGDEPVFQGREVVLGPRAGDEYVVAEGLTEGELVVVNGNFKIDSALQIQARPSMMNPAGGGPAPGHQHGADGATGTADSATGAADGASDAGVRPVHEAPPAFRDQLGRLLDAYLGLQAALADDDFQSARDAAQETAAALENVDMGLVPGPAHAAWMEQQQTMQESLATMATAEEIEQLRRPLFPLSTELWHALATFGYHHGDTARFFHCPMARGNAGADWIQLATTVDNPYYGASMLRCGSETATLPPAAALAEETPQ
ncbi:MAG: efflux RND transporter periplasmic adaptor subunit [Candidatus Krumholzibacteriia bacterium]